VVRRIGPRDSVSLLQHNLRVSLLYYGRRLIAPVPMRDYHRTLRPLARAGNGLPGPTKLDEVLALPGTIKMMTSNDE
jgi:hypothetical protein